MKKNHCFVELLVTLCVIICSTNIGIQAKNTNISNIVQLISSLEDKQLVLSKRYSLEDIYGDLRYELVEFKDGGYGIYDFKTNEIIEYNLETKENPYSEYVDLEKSLVYCGPLNYLIRKYDKYYEIRTNKEVDIESTRKYYSNLENETISSTNDTTNWNGLSGAYFVVYNGVDWQNNGANSNCCGPLSSAIMLAYYQDYLPSIIAFNSSIRTSGSLGPGQLINKIKGATISPTSTVPATISSGVQSVLNSYNISGTYNTVLTSTATWNVATSKINAGRPLCIGISGLAMYNGVNPYDYGWHWVTAYGYRSINGSGYFKCIDNWGHRDVAIKTTTTVGAIYLDH